MAVDPRKRWRMTRKDDKETERPHYYSQFWLDVAAGRRVIGTPKGDDGIDSSELDMPEPVTRKSPRASATSVMDGHRASQAHDDIQDSEDDYETEDEYIEPDVEEDELASDLDDDDIPTLVVDDAVEADAVEELEPLPVAVVEDEEPESLEDEEEYFDDEEEEDEDTDWSARGRKKPKPGRQIKTPKPLTTKKPKRGGRTY